MTVQCPKCKQEIGILDLFIVLEKNNILGIFDSQIKADSYAKAFKNKKTKIKKRMLNKPIELVES
jgi:hypothetical protein